MIAHRLIGSGPSRVVALHGWFGSARAWRPLTEILDPELLSVACIDYRGYGDRIDVEGEYTLEEIARDALQLADELGWERFHLMGHSMGGTASQRVMVEAPQRVGRMLAITPVPASGVPFDDATWALFASAADEVGARRGIIDFSTGNRLSPHWVAAVAARSVAESNRAAFGAYLTAWAKTDFSARVAKTDVPLHIVVGEHDPSLTLELMQATTLRWCPRATIEVMANAGHYPIDETPVALATVVEKVFAAPA